jgi:hypothetical protein
MTSLALRLGAHLSADYGHRFMLIAVCMVASIAGLSFMHVGPSFAQSLLLFGKLAGVFLIAGFSLALVQVPRYATVTRIVSGFFLALGQHVAFITASLGLATIAASFHAPLLDATFMRWDTWLGFDWDTAAAWSAAHPWAEEALQFAYASMFWQTLFFLFVYSVRGSGEFIWFFMVTLLSVIALSAFFPALGHAGWIGQEHINALLAAREGSASVVSGIITFPSFHAALAVLFIYASRHDGRMLAVAVPLNLLLIAATPTCGGHYCVDTLAGIGVTLAVILLASGWDAVRIRL